MRLGYTVEAHNEPRQALAVFRDDPSAWDLVITDRSMPKMSGEELVAELQAARAGIPILMLSGYVSNEDSERLATIGLAGVIGKPVFPEELATAVRTTLSQSEPDARQSGAAQA